MPNAPRIFLAWFVIALVAGIGVSLNVAVRRVEPERWFLPGPLGYEPGVPVWSGEGFMSGLLPRGDRRASTARGQSNVGRVPSPGGNPQSPDTGFTSRVFSGGSGPAGAAWERRNGRTAYVPFMHNLDQVFPLSLYDEHPEYFPAIVGSYYRRFPGAWAVWQPELGRTDAARHAAGEARKYFDSQPKAEAFSLGINDGLAFGESPELLALVAPRAAEDGGPTTDDGLGPPSPLSPQSSDVRLPPSGRWPGGWFRNRPDYSPLVFTFMNRVAGELEKTHPDKYLGALAYYWAENAPGFPVHRQVIPFVTADRSQGYDPAFWKEEMDLQRRWARAMGIALRGAVGGRRTDDRGRMTEDGGQSAITSSGQPSALSPPPSALRPRIGLYDYLDGPGFLIPRIHTRLIAEHLRHAWEVGFTDYYAEGAANWGLDGPMHWLVAQLVQDPLASPDRLLEEYYRRTYGPAAGPMRRFFERCEEIWMRQPTPAYWLKFYYSESQAQLFPAGVRRELVSILDEALASAGSPRRGDRDDRARRGGPAVPAGNRFATRVGLVATGFSLTEAFCAFQEARDALSRQVLPPPGDGARPSGDGRAEAIRQDLEAYLGARTAFLALVERLQREQPLAIAPFGLRNFMRNDPVVAALVAIADAHPSPAVLAKLRPMPGLPAGWETLLARPGSDRVRIDRNGDLTGPVAPARYSAGLEVGVALPAPWTGSDEPSQTQQAVLLPDGDSGDSRLLRVTGSKRTAVTWESAVGGGDFLLGSVQMRGRVSPGNLAEMRFVWVDDKGASVADLSHRLPEGDWPEWITLHQGGSPPAGAVRLSLGLRVEHQVPGDWVEVRRFRLTK